MIRHKGHPPVGLVLAGGESTRMPGGNKALAQFAGKPLLQHVLERVGPQVGHILLSVHATDATLSGFGLEQVVDRVQRQRGPLTGLYSALRLVAERGWSDWLLLTPCDAPFLPLDLGARLLEAATTAACQLAVARSSGEVQPVFSLWHTGTLAVLESEVLERGRGGLRRLLGDIPHVAVDWPQQRPDPFTNINSPADLRAAEVDVRWPEDRH